MKPDFSISLLILGAQPEHEYEELLTLARSRGYQVQCEYSPEINITEHMPSRIQKVDLVLLDVGATWENFLLHVQQKVGAGVHTPLVILSEDSDVNTRIAAFKAGADDFILKPYLPDEVLLRVQAILRRCLGFLQAEEEDCIHAGGVSLDRHQQVVYIHGKAVEVTPLEFRLLWLLVYYRGRVLSKSYTYSSVLGRDYSDFDRSIDMHLSRVRKKLSRAGFAAERLKTVRNRGYCFS